MHDEPVYDTGAKPRLAIDILADLIDEYELEIEDDIAARLMCEHDVGICACQTRGLLDEVHEVLRLHNLHVHCRLKERT